MVRVVAPEAMRGERVSITDGEHVLDWTRLRRRDGRSEALVTLPMPAWGEPYDPLEVCVGGDARSFALVPDADRLRRQAIKYAEVAADRFVFTGKDLPPCDFAQPTRVEQLGGRYTAETTYYDRDLRMVTSAENPGRYGAIVRSRTRHAGTITRYVTLYRADGELPGTSRIRRSQPWDIGGSLPEALGIPNEVLQRQAGLVSSGLTELIVGSFSRDAASAVVLAGLREIAPDAVGASVWHADERWWYQLRKRIGDLEPLKYLVFLPEGYEENGDEAWPLLMFLHGAGERGDDLERVKVHGPPKVAAAGGDVPFIIVAPQCPLDTWWSVWQVRDLLDEVRAHHRVDDSRLYLTGLSMGGFGTWKMIAEFPDLFAAAVAICGGGDPATAPAMGQLPIWAFHGAKDTVVPLSGSESMVEALHAAGNPAQLTVYPEAGHDSWTETYDNPELYEWLLRHRREG